MKHGNGAINPEDRKRYNALHPRLNKRGGKPYRQSGPLHRHQIQMAKNKELERIALRQWQQPIKKGALKQWKRLIKNL